MGRGPREQAWRSGWGARSEYEDPRKYRCWRSGWSTQEKVRGDFLGAFECYLVRGRERGGVPTLSHWCIWPPGWVLTAEDKWWSFTILQYNFSQFGSLDFLYFPNHFEAQMSEWFLWSIMDNKDANKCHSYTYWNVVTVSPCPVFLQTTSEVCSSGTNVS